MSKLYKVVCNAAAVECGIKIGDKVEVLFFEEELEDAPDDYIGSVGEVSL